MFFKGHTIKKIEFPSDIDKKVLEKMINSERILAFSKLFVSFIALILGVWLISIGVKSDDSMISLKIGDAVDLTLNKVYPGVACIIVSLIMFYFSQINIKITKS